MSDERGIVGETVTKFLLSTCRQQRQLTFPALQALMYSAEVACNHPDGDVEAEVVPMPTGSVAEFYIEPMVPHFGDIDVMYHFSIDLAIPAGQAPPTQLPAEFHKYVKVHEIVDSHLPGYVYLKLRYLLTKCVDDDQYNAVEYDREMYLSNRTITTNENESHGPAKLYHNLNDESLSLDVVRCVRCLSWPPEADAWPTRHRNYGWPDSATVDRVVSSGCDVVGVAHRQCRQHEWMGKRQWRLSFSRAEIVLINSWMPEQQIVYHMLRVFMKTYRLTESADNSEAGTLSNYHIKTLMLWACELKPRRWWTDDVNLVRICVELLHTLSVCLTNTRCLHYFVNNCNLMNNFFSVEIIASQLMSIDEAWLSTWFVKNYIRVCSQFCPDHVSRLFDDVSTSMKLENAVSAVVHWRLNSTLDDSWVVFFSAELNILQSFSRANFTEAYCDYWMTELLNVDTRLRPYFIAVAFLHVSRRISRSGFSDELMDALALIFERFVGTRRRSSQHSSVLSLSRAARLMKIVAKNSRSTMQLIEIELSKAYLYRALRCKDSDSDSIYCLANVYLAVLYYTTGHYQTAIDHCTLVTRSQDHSHCSSHVVQGELLPKIDDVIDNSLGLCVLYEYVLRTTTQQQTQHVSVFTTELFAHYLHIRCLSECCHLTQMSLTDEIQQYRKYISDTQQLLIADVCVLKWMHLLLGQHLQSKQVKRESGKVAANPTGLNTSELAELLQKSAIEHLTTHRQIEARDFGSVATIVTTDFEALYAYKRGDYQQCLRLSIQNVRTLLYAVNVPYVWALPDFIELLDDDIVSLTALTLIVNPNCRAQDNRYACVTQLTLSLYLMTKCQLKLRHPVTSLAETLDILEFAYRRHTKKGTLSHLTFELAKRLVRMYALACLDT